MALELNPKILTDDENKTAEADTHRTGEGKHKREDTIQDEQKRKCVDKQIDFV